MRGLWWERLSGFSPLNWLTIQTTQSSPSSGCSMPLTITSVKKISSSCALLPSEVNTFRLRYFVSIPRSPPSPCHTLRGKNIGSFLSVSVKMSTTPIRTHAAMRRCHWLSLADQWCRWCKSEFTNSTSRIHLHFQFSTQVSGPSIVVKGLHALVLPSRFS